METDPCTSDRKGILDFCYVATLEGSSVPIKYYLQEYGMKHEFCGVSPLDNMKYLYAVYYDKIADLESKGAKMGVCSSRLFKGIATGENSADVLLSRIPEDLRMEFFMYYNREEYVAYLEGCEDKI